jgi:DNA-binding helix-hairpin-helix protein with protein kinase domain
MPPKLFDSQGKPFQLNSQVGCGGQGDIYKVDGHSRLLAKIYSVPPDATLQQKLQTMLQMTDPELRQFCAWPQDLIRSGSPSGPIVGFVMDFFKDSIQLKNLMVPSDRIFYFPRLNWKDLVQLAEHLAKVVSIVHRRNIVIGDLHPENILVNPAVQPQLIDCDSWQITTPHGTLPCTVLREEYTAPELQGVDFSRIELTKNHDVFALAIMMFQCLFLGQDPFTGSYSGKGDNHRAAAIREHRYAYAKNTRRTKTRPPKKSLKPSELTPELADLFEQAFLRTKNRPPAEQWHKAIRDFRQQLDSCSRNNSHFHGKKQRKCRFCEYEDAFLTSHFPNVTAQAIATANAAWAPSPACQQLPRMVLPTVTFPVEGPTGAVNLPPLSERVRTSIRLEVWASQALLLGMAFNVVSILLGQWLLPPMVLTLIIFLMLACYVPFSASHRQIRQLRRSAYASLRAASKEEKSLQKTLKSAAGGGIREIEDIRPLGQRLDETVQDYRVFHQNLRQRHERQAKIEWLKSQFITTTGTPGLSKIAIEDLAKKGITSAAQVQADQLDQIQSLSSRQKSLLLNWRHRVESSYRTPPYQSQLTANVFAREFSFYQNRLPLEKCISETVAKVQNEVDQLNAKTQFSLIQVKSLRTSAAVDAQQADRIRDELWQPLVHLSGKFLAALVIACLCAPACKYALSMIPNRASTDIDRHSPSHRDSN